VYQREKLREINVIVFFNVYLETVYQRLHSVDLHKQERKKDGLEEEEEEEKEKDIESSMK
jgi:hypothetical protein